jgi:hypothetical protein
MNSEQILVELAGCKGHNAAVFYQEAKRRQADSNSLIESATRIEREQAACIDGATAIREVNRLTAENALQSDLIGKMEKQINDQRNAEQRLSARVQELEADIKAASGAFAMPMPQPGTDMAKMMISNRLLARRAEKAETDRDQLREALKRIQWNYAKTTCPECNRRDIDGHAKWCRVAIALAGHAPESKPARCKGSFCGSIDPERCARCKAGPAPEGGACG